MRKLRSKSGFTLMEMMVSILILVLLVSAMGTGMDAGMRVYADSTFESDSASLAGIVNNAVGDMLRYAEDIKMIDPSVTNPAPEDVEFVFTNREYGVADAYFCIGNGVESDLGTLYMKNVRNNDVVDLLGNGAYPKLELVNFKIHYFEPGATSMENGVETSIRGGYFELEYDIISQTHKDKIRHVDSIVRHLNAE